ncbi:unnamed protein product [Chilo suppressalis]|uniref:Uncharacterized protein n=1 Tax=Chilo suppressalis TaxID=168631 RepID=A0ABN8BFY0_CHISP|nr:unnamed protein product [Chilo suppressalis]
MPQRRESFLYRSDSDFEMSPKSISKTAGSPARDTTALVLQSIPQRRESFLYRSDFEMSPKSMSSNSSMATTIEFSIDNACWSSISTSNIDYRRPPPVSISAKFILGWSRWRSYAGRAAGGESGTPRRRCTSIALTAPLIVRAARRRHAAYVLRRNAAASLRNLPLNAKPRQCDITNSPSRGVLFTERAHLKLASSVEVVH